VYIPSVEDIQPVSSQLDDSSPASESKDSMLDPNLFEIPQEKETAGTQEDLSEKAWDELQKSRGGGRIEHEPLPERKLPWIIDIFLYPTNKAGLTMLAIFIMVPLLMEILVRVLSRSSILLLNLVAILLLIISVIVNVAIMLYRYWYLSECIRDSSEGRIRTPETIAETPGIFELFPAFFKIFVCIFIFMVPLFYHITNSKDIPRDAWSFFIFILFFWWIVISEVGKGGITFHLFLLFAAFFLPMTVLSVIMHDSFRGLNPIRIIRSIVSTLFPYFGMVLLLCIFGIPVVLIRKFIITEAVSGRPGLSLYFPRAISIYLMLVAAHLLGRFYWKYEEKLYWDV